jgi:hypothetical protein
MRSLPSMSDGYGASSDAVAAAAAIDRFVGDERLAAIFRQMREIVGVSQSEMARRLGTNVSTLPSWPEIVRIVDRYAELAQVDPSPLLSRLLQLQAPPDGASGRRPLMPVRPLRPAATQALSSDPARRPMPSRAAIPVLTEDRPRGAVAVSSPQWVQPQRGGRPEAHAAAGTTDEQAVGFDGRSRTRETTVRTARQATPSADAINTDVVVARRRRRRRRTALVLAPILTIVVGFAGMLFAPRPFYRVAKVLPTSVASPLLSLLDTAVLQTATVRDGLRWIELDDPRLRKGDRLQR